MASSARIDELRKKFDENPRRYFAPLANEYRKLGDLEQAIFICQEYLPQQPGHMSGHIVYGQALFELSRFDESRAVFETALSLDPENLIALRHLGDIARQAGDLRGARGWYQRVLEADPRNEEIAQIMMTLLATPDDSMPAVSPAPASDVLTTVPVDGARVPTPLSSVVIEKSQDVVDLGDAPELSSLRDAAAEAASAPIGPIPTAPPAAAPPISTWGAPAVDEHELLDLEDFSVGGVPLSSLGAPPPEIEPVVPPPIPEAAGLETFDEIELERASVEPTPPITAAPQASSTEHVDRGGAEESFEADPFAITATPGSSQPPVEASPIELATDLDLGLRPDGVSSTTFSESQGERIADLETYGETLKGADAADLSAPLEIDTFFSGMSRETGPLGEPAVGSSADHVETRTPTPQFVEAIPAFSTNLPPSVEETTTPSVEATAPPPTESDLPLDEPPPIPDLDSFDLPSLGMTSTELPVFGRPFTPPVADTALPAFDTPPVEPEPVASEVLKIPEALEEPEAPEVFEVFEVFEAPDVPEAVAAPTVEAVQPVPTTWTPEPQPAVPSEEFVTETMAELYLEQGHPEAAIDIYRRLIAQRPDDEQLASRLRGVEAALNGETVTAAEQAPAPAARSVGPTIREFLAGLLRFVPAGAVSEISEAPAERLAEAQAVESEAAIAAPSVPTPVYDFEAIEARRAPTPPYDLDAIAARSVPTPIYGLPEVEATPPVVEETVVDESPIVEEQSEPGLVVPDALEESDPVLDLPDVDAPALSSIDDMELAPPDSADATLAFSTPVEPPEEQPVPVRPTPARSTPARSRPVSPFAAVAGIPTPVKPTLVRATPGSSETVSGSIDALFSGASASSADSEAAAALSQAFSPEAPEPVELPGKPAHAASNELSLDHVFKSTPPRPKEGESDGFSFDQFFADDLAQGAPKSGAEPPAAPGNSTSGGDAGDDIAQFNNWLNSLKKT